MWQRESAVPGFRGQCKLGVLGSNVEAMGWGSHVNEGDEDRGWIVLTGMGSSGWLYKFDSLL